MAGALVRLYSNRAASHYPFVYESRFRCVVNPALVLLLRGVTISVVAEI